MKKTFLLTVIFLFLVSFTGCIKDKSKNHSNGSDGQINGDSNNKDDGEVNLKSKLTKMDYKYDLDDASALSIEFLNPEVALLSNNDKDHKKGYLVKHGKDHKKEKVDIIEKNKDKEETKSQDDVDYEFNKLYVNGDFTFVQYATTDRSFVTSVDGSNFKVTTDGVNMCNFRSFYFMELTPEEINALENAQHWSDEYWWCRWNRYGHTKQPDYIGMFYPYEKEDDGVFVFDKDFTSFNTFGDKYFQNYVIYNKTGEVYRIDYNFEIIDDYLVVQFDNLVLDLEIVEGSLTIREVKFENINNINMHHLIVDKYGNYFVFDAFHDKVDIENKIKYISNQHYNQIDERYFFTKEKEVVVYTQKEEEGKKIIKIFVFNENFELVPMEKDFTALYEIRYGFCDEGVGIVNYWYKTLKVDFRMKNNVGIYSSRFILSHYHNYDEESQVWSNLHDFDDMNPIIVFNYEDGEYNIVEEKERYNKEYHVFQRFYYNLENGLNIYDITNPDEQISIYSGNNLGNCSVKSLNNRYAIAYSSRFNKKYILIIDENDELVVEEYSEYMFKNSPQKIEIFSDK